MKNKLVYLVTIKDEKGKYLKQNDEFIQYYFEKIKDLYDFIDCNFELYGKDKVNIQEVII